MLNFSLKIMFLLFTSLNNVFVTILVSTIFSLIHDLLTQSLKLTQQSLEIKVGHVKFEINEVKS